MAKRSGRKATRREVAEQMRAEYRQRERRAKRMWILFFVVIAVVGVASIGYAVVSTRSSSASLQGVETYKGLSQTHVTTPVKYPQTPPVGGEHNPTPLTCGIYTSPVPAENAVHSMEHGAVWITYRPSLSPTDVKTLQDAARGNPYVIMSPYPGLPVPVVASAWGTQLKLPNVTDSRLAEFIRTYAQGPQTPEPGAACSGVGAPQG